MAFLALAVGFVLLLVGGELLVRGAGRLALALGVPPLVVGLTVVAFATSAPELSASVVASLSERPEIAVANVIGSNVANIGLIAALAALVRPIAVSTAFLWREVPMLLLASATTVAVVWDGAIQRWEAGVLLAILAVYTAVLIRMEARASEPQLEAAVRANSASWSVVGNVAMVVLAVGLLIGGASALVQGATEVARSFGVTDRVIGLTVVAVGTSLPELAASVAASWRGQGDMALGNVVGSNIFNSLGILGVSTLVAPMNAGADAFVFDALIAAGFALLLAPLLRRGMRLTRGEGALALMAYVAFMAWVA